MLCTAQPTIKANLIKTSHLKAKRPQIANEPFMSSLHPRPLHQALAGGAAGRPACAFEERQTSRRPPSLRAARCSLAVNNIFLLAAFACACQNPWQAQLSRWDDPRGFFIESRESSEVRETNLSSRTLARWLKLPLAAFFSHLQMGKLNTSTSLAKANVSHLMNACFFDD